MTVLLIAQTDSTGEKVTLIVFALVAVAAALALLTAWYWRVTDPALRNDEARGRGGRRRPKNTEPEPEPEPGDEASTRPGGSDGSEPSTDDTRLLKRSDILSPTEPQAEPDVIDLRADTAVAGSRGGGPVDDITGEIDVGRVVQPSDQQDPKAWESPMLDVDAVEAVEAGPAGAHDAGIDFDEWLALAEEES